MSEKLNYQFHWSCPPLAQSAQAERVVALGQALGVLVEEQITVVPGRGCQGESAGEQDLAGGGLEQVGAADDFGNAHGGVIHDHGELVGRHVVATPDEKVAKVAASDEALGAEVAV
jgi:hypothetical protein